MGEPTGFKDHLRDEAPYRDARERILDFDEIYTPHDHDRLTTQSARCMDCGVPFCQSHAPDDHRISKGGCPIHNLIPEWNDLVYRGHWRDALDRLHQTNNFPEFTGRVCPAPCEGSCVLGITDPPVTIKNIEMAIIDNGFKKGWVVANPPTTRTGRSVAIVGSGPAGLAAAAELNSAGHYVTVFERADRIGGLLMYGIPNMKLDKKRIVNRRIELMRQEGIDFVTNTDVSGDGTGDASIRSLLTAYDSVLLATGATVPNNLPVPGRELNGIHFAMDYLTANTKSLLDSGLDDGQYIDAAGKDVLVIGGGDTGTDCIGTAMRHGCNSLINFELFPSHPDDRATSNPWPEYPMIFRVDYGHKEVAAKFGDDPRVFGISTKTFLDDGDGNVRGVVTIDVKLEDGNVSELPGTQREWKTDLVLLAMGFRGPENYTVDSLTLDFDPRSNYAAIKGDYQTNVDNLFAAGDCRSGQSLIVRAINEGREAAREIDTHLMGASNLPG